MLARQARGAFSREGELVLGFDSILWLDSLVEIARKAADENLSSDDVEKLHELLAALDRQAIVLKSCHLGRRD